MYRLLPFLLSFCLFSFSQAEGDTRIAPVPADGLSPAALAAVWWQWAAGAPDMQDPLADARGDFCAYGQSGAVWFLSGSYSPEKVVRHCRIPAGKYLFFPIISMMLWDGPDGQSCSQLHADVGTAIDTVRDLVVEIDGKLTGNLQHYRYATKECFAISGDTDHYASDGYWILLKPLPSGRHTLHFGGRIGDDGRTAENFTQDINYILDVE